MLITLTLADGSIHTFRPPARQRHRLSWCMQQMPWSTDYYGCVWEITSITKAEEISIRQNAHVFTPNEDAIWLYGDDFLPVKIVSAGEGDQLICLAPDGLRHAIRSFNLLPASKEDR